MKQLKVKNRREKQNNYLIKVWNLVDPNVDNDSYHTLVKLFVPNLNERICLTKDIINEAIKSV